MPSLPIVECRTPSARQISRSTHQHLSHRNEQMPVSGLVSTCNRSVKQQVNSCWLWKWVIYLRIPPTTRYKLDFNTYCLPHGRIHPYSSAGYLTHLIGVIRETANTHYNTTPSIQLNSWFRCSTVYSWRSLPLRLKNFINSISLSVTAHRRKDVRHPPPSRTTHSIESISKHIPSLHGPVTGY